MSKKTILLLIVATTLIVGVAVYAAKEVSWEDADQYYGQEVTVTGTIVATHNSGKACFLNFHSNWKRYFTAVIFASDFDKFPDNPEDYYLNKKVKVTGRVKEYKDKPEIILKSPSQIEIVKSGEKPKKVVQQDIPEKTDLAQKVHDLSEKVKIQEARITALEFKVRKLEDFLEPQAEQKK